MNFDQLLATDYQHPTVAIFYGHACAPCDHLKPRLREVCTAMGLRLEEFNSAGELPAIHKLDLRTVPAVYLVHKGKATLVFTGMLEKNQIRGVLLRAGSGELI